MPESREAGRRVLVLCADIGEGHVTVARTLAEQLRARPDIAHVDLRSDLRVMGERFGGFMEHGFHVHLDGIGQPGRRLPSLSYELGYRVFFERAGPRAAGHLALAALGGRGLKATIARHRPDVVVTEYPVLSAALGQLRALGRLGVPVVSSISDPAGLYYWAHPGIDLHLLLWPESLAEAVRIAGPGRAAVVRPYVDTRILRAPGRVEARAALGLPEDGLVVLVSGGGWGVGDLTGAAAVVRGERPDATIVCLAGRSEAARARLTAQADGDERTRVLGFTDRMAELLPAADVIVHTTGGTTALEARLVGCRLITFDASVAHVRAHARALEALGVAPYAPDRAALPDALRRSLAQPAPPPLRSDTRPEAASLVAAIARSSQPGRRRPANHSAAATSASTAGPGA